MTSAHAPLYPDGKETGLFITEALHPYNVFKEAGLEVDFVSETGTYQADWLSQTEDWLKGDDKKTWEDTSSGFRKGLEAIAKAGDVDPDQVSAVSCLSLATVGVSQSRHDNEQQSPQTRKPSPSVIRRPEQCCEGGPFDIYCGLLYLIKNH